MMDQIEFMLSQADRLRQEAEWFHKNGRASDVEAIEAYVKELRVREIAKLALEPGQNAPDFTLPDGEGRMVTLSEELKKGPVILTWYRGGWCPYCNIQLNHLQKFVEKFSAAGATLIALSPELPRRNIATRDRHRVSFEILTDVNNGLAKKYGGVQVLNEEVKGYYGRMGVMDYYYDRKPEEFPVPATYVVDADFLVRYAFVEADFRRRAEPEQVLEAVLRLREEKRQPG